MWHRTCRWLGLEKVSEQGLEQGRDTTRDQYVDPEVVVSKQQDSQSPVAFSPDCWVHQQNWLCEALRSMDKDQGQDLGQGASSQAPDSGVSVSFDSDEGLECGSRRGQERACKGEEISALRRAWLL